MYTAMLELAISLIFLYLLLSAACSAIQEIIANLFHWRAKTLEKGIAGLFRSERFKKELYESSLFQSLCSPDRTGRRTRKPSYIPPATFALAVLDVKKKTSLVPNTGQTPGGGGGGGQNNPAVQGANAAGGTKSGLGPDDLAKASELLESLLLGANTIEEQRKRIENWFNDSMDRVSGWYKRKSNLWLWIIGIVLSVLANADSISLANVFWNDPTMRAATVAAATKYVETNPAPQKTATSQTPSGPATGGQAAGQPDKGTNASSSSSTPGDDEAANPKEVLRRLREVRDQLGTAQIPMGWCVSGDAAGQEPKCWPVFAPKAAAETGMSRNSAATTEADSIASDPRLIKPYEFSLRYLGWWLTKLFGIAVTALAISQGAPFWFDLLKKAVNLRLAGSAPDEKKQNK
jgi:hypothetical protein